MRSLNSLEGLLGPPGGLTLLEGLIVMVGDRGGMPLARELGERETMPIGPGALGVLGPVGTTGGSRTITGLCDGEEEGGPDDDTDDLLPVDDPAAEGDPGVTATADSPAETDDDGESV